MTLQEAKPFLDKPVFGDQHCIDALRLYRLAQGVKKLREVAGYSYSDSEIEAMDEEQLYDEADWLFSDVEQKDYDDWDEFFEEHFA